MSDKEENVSVIVIPHMYSTSTGFTRSHLHQNPYCSKSFTDLCLQITRFALRLLSPPLIVSLIGLRGTKEN